ncbi:Alpha/Beta hydrolase protein [Mycena galopus ATCC 62051]|nr:Alpha/Beta hydrolase protein [Mycena galopus ATCC 62051]
MSVLGISDFSLPAAVTHHTSDVDRCVGTWKFTHPVTSPASVHLHLETHLWMHGTNSSEQLWSDRERLQALLFTSVKIDRVYYRYLMTSLLLDVNQDRQSEERRVGHRTRGFASVPTCPVNVNMSFPPLFVSRFLCVNASTTVQLGDTTLIGYIPYTDPPLADLRFKAPVAKSSLAPGPFNATKYGPACLQGLPLSQMSEDCLTINVLRPAGVSAEAKLPVGIKDVIPALQWAQHNIESFGNNKDKVTLFSQSAGSVITSILFLHPSLISESGYQGTAQLFPPACDEVDWETFVSGVPSCSDLATSRSTFDCLAQANTTEIFQGFTLVTAESTTLKPWPPVLDGPGGLIPDLPSALFNGGQFARLPFIAGTVLDEGAENNLHLVSVFAILISDHARGLGTTLLELYPDIPPLGSPFGTGNDTLGLSSQFKRAAAWIGDSNFESRCRFWMDTAANAGVETFGYLFTQPQPIPSAIGELVYVFGKPNDTSAQAEELSQIMTDYWVSFATSLTPNNGLGPTTGMDAIHAGKQEQIAFFNSDSAIWRR